MNRRRAALSWFACFVAVVSRPAPLPAQTAPAAAALPNDDVVVARVNGEIVPFREVRQQLAGVLQGRPIPLAIWPQLSAQALEQVIGRRLVSAEMKRRGLKPTADELKQAEENFTKNLTRRGITRADYLRQNALTEGDLEAVRTWEIGWNRFAKELLTDDLLEQFYNSHRRDFDGTELRVSHILFRIEGHQDQATLAAATAKANSVREAITSGALKFADAAKQYSTGPSREQGGDLGFIPRHERMAEEFSAAAFELRVGEVSPPTTTPFGVHLITVTEEKPGTIRWQAVREKLVAAAQPSLFRQLVAQLRPRMSVEYTDAIPHFDPTTGQIAPGRS